MATTRRLALLTAVAILSAAGCGGNYWANRGDDLRDILRLNGGVGPGLALHGRVSRVPQVGAGYYTALKWGMVGEEYGQWYEHRMDANLITGFGTSERTRVLGNIVNHPHTLGKKCDWSLGDNNRRWGEIELNAWLVFFGAEAGVDVIEAVDFVVGIFGIDLTDDDNAGEKPPEPQLCQVKEPAKPYLLTQKPAAKEPAAAEQPAEGAAQPAEEKSQ